MLKKQEDLLPGEWVIGRFHCDSEFPDYYRGHEDNLEVLPDEQTAREYASDLDAEELNCLGEEAFNSMGEQIWKWWAMPITKAGAVPRLSDPEEGPFDLFIPPNGMTLDKLLEFLNPLSKSHGDCPVISPGGHPIVRVWVDDDGLYFSDMTDD